MEIVWIDAEEVESDGTSVLEGLDGILIPGGFGSRGVEGKIRAVEFARSKQIPFFGICLGMQCAVIEFARNVAKLPDANSLEYGSCANPVIGPMPGQEDLQDLGGTMRLGSYPCVLAEDSHSYRAYGVDLIDERHRHR